MRSWLAISYVLSLGLYFGPLAKRNASHLQAIVYVLSAGQFYRLEFDGHTEDIDQASARERFKSFVRKASGILAIVASMVALYEVLLITEPVFISLLWYVAGTLSVALNFLWGSAYQVAAAAIIATSVVLCVAAVTLVVCQTPITTAAQRFRRLGQEGKLAARVALRNLFFARPSIEPAKAEPQSPTSNPLVPIKIQYTRSWEVPVIIGLANALGIPTDSVELHGSLAIHSATCAATGSPYEGTYPAFRPDPLDELARLLGQNDPFAELFR